MNTAIRAIGCVFMLLSLAACDFCLYSEEFVYAGIMLFCALVFFIIVCCVKRKNLSASLAASGADGNSDPYSTSFYSDAAGETEPAVRVKKKKNRNKSDVDVLPAEEKKENKRISKNAKNKPSQPWRDLDDDLPEAASPSGFMTGAAFVPAAGGALFDSAGRSPVASTTPSYASAPFASEAYYDRPANTGAYSSGAMNQSSYNQGTGNPGFYNGGAMPQNPVNGVYTQTPGMTQPVRPAGSAVRATFPGATAGIKYMRYCKGCGFLGSQLASEPVPPCPTCGARLFASDMPLSEFTMLDQRKRSAIMKKWSKAV